jgi:molybdopterin/thiamine biosynthesis adenylyltransferase
VPGSLDRIIPHAETDGVLCLFPTTASFAIAAPVDLVRDALRAAVQLIEDSRDGRNEADFRTEFLSYWTHHAPTTPPRVLSLLDSEPTTRAIRAWRGKAMYVVGESDAAITGWLGRRFPKEANALETEAAVLLWLERAPLPAEYPRTALDVLTLADRAGEAARRLLLELVASAPKRAVVILGVPTERGPAFAAIVVGGPSCSAAPWHRGADPLTAGFRPGKVPIGVISHRFFGSQQVRCGDVDRVDPAWIHGRGADARFKTLQGARVAVLGCGSVGAPVAVALAQAGVGELMLIDPEVLASANIGRHVLGAESLGSNKATALADHLRVRFPHMKAVEPYALRWDEAARKAPDMFASCNLIVSTIGDWAAEGALNERHVRQGRQRPIVYGWTEPHACAGHAVAVFPAGGCLQCGLTEFGEPVLRVTDWPTGPTLRQEPACGATYQPYGPVELMYVTALVSELAVDCLLAVRSLPRRSGSGAALVTRS